MYRCVSLTLCMAMLCRTEGPSREIIQLSYRPTACSIHDPPENGFFFTQRGADVVFLPPGAGRPTWFRSPGKCRHLAGKPGSKRQVALERKRLCPLVGSFSSRSPKHCRTPQARHFAFGFLTRRDSRKEGAIGLSRPRRLQGGEDGEAGASRTKASGLLYSFHGCCCQKRSMQPSFFGGRERSSHTMPTRVEETWRKGRYTSL